MYVTHLIFTTILWDWWYNKVILQMRNLRHREIKWPIQSHSARECRAETEAGTVWFQSTSDLNCYTLLPCWLSPNSNPNHFLVVYFVSPSIFHFYQKWHGAWAIVNTPDRTFLKQIIYGVIFAVHLFTHWLARFYLPFFFLTSPLKCTVFLLLKARDAYERKKIKSHLMFQFCIKTH